MAESDCFVCRKHRGLEPVPGGAIFEDELIFAGHSWSVSDGSTAYAGAFIVEPKRHVPGWAELTDEEAGAMGTVMRDVSKAMQESLGAEHVYVFVLGHHVPHLHVWLVPRFPGTPREFWGLQLFEWPDRPMGGAAEVEAVCEQIRSAIV